MKRFDSDYGQEFERLKKMEFADRFEPATRLVAVCTAGSLIWIYTGWTSALLWPVYYAAAIFAHLFYIMKRKSVARYREVVISALLFTNLQIAFAWLPLLLFFSTNQVLLLVGGPLIFAQLLFLVRRSDTLRLYSYTRRIFVIA